MWTLIERAGNIFSLKRQDSGHKEAVFQFLKDSLGKRELTCQGAYRGEGREGRAWLPQRGSSDVSRMAGLKVAEANKRMRA